MTRVETLLSELLREMRGLRADLRRRNESSPDLIAALDDYFGPARFTTAGVLDIADDEPHGALACALADVIDLGASARARATALGALLAKLQDVEIVARQRGCAVYRVRTCDE